MQIHATIGPASLAGNRNVDDTGRDENPGGGNPGGQADALEKLVLAGADALRINMSHTTHAALSAIVGRARRTAPGIPIGVDLRSRKLRIGPLAGGSVTLFKGDRFTLFPVEDESLALENIAPDPGPTPDMTSNRASYPTTTPISNRAAVNYPAMPRVVAPGQEILLDDGAVSLIVVEVRQDGAGRDSVVCEIARGGVVPERSGVNLPGHRSGVAALTAKDHADLDAAAALRVDFVYLSFVETAEDIKLLREALGRRRLDAAIIAKVERAVALENLGEIARAADSICIARGDLGVEVPFAKIPSAQRQIVKAAKEANTPVLLAGEVLFSLVTRLVPFRAELTDVINALEQGVDGFVLSDETAVGVDPANAVSALRMLVRGFGLL
jgi:pyruvate kinase